MIVREMTFVILGVAMPQERRGQHAFIVDTPKGPRARARAYDPKKSRGWKEVIRQTVAAQKVLSGMRDSPLHDGPVELEIVFVLPRPKSLPRKIRRHNKKPDLDNLEKAVKDALKGLIYTDDGRVDGVIKHKRYGDPPCVVLKVRFLSNDSEEISWGGVEVCQAKFDAVGGGAVGK